MNEDSVSDQTQILLVNAAYFVTNWMKKFPEAEIKECPFKVSKVCSEKKESTVSSREKANFELRKSQPEKHLRVRLYSQYIQTSMCMRKVGVSGSTKILINYYISQQFQLKKF